jgi:hypothetical protein
LKRLSDQTLYEILEVSVEAPPEEIERAYQRASALYGPGSLATYSLVTPDEAQLLTNRIEEARAVLLDPDARSRYDERIGVRPRAAPAPATGHGLATPWPPPSLPLVPPPPAEPPSPPEAAPEGISAASVPPAPAPAPPPGGAGPPATPPGGPPPIALDTPISTPPPGLLEAVTSPVESLPPVATPASPGSAALTSSPAGAGPVPPAPIPRKNELAAPRELLVPEGAAWTGEMLRQVREARGLTLPQLSERTKVTRHHLENIEADRFKALPAPVYLRGILMSLARELRLDGQRVARSYLERQASAGADAPRK